MNETTHPALQALLDTIPQSSGRERDEAGGYYEDQYRLWVKKGFEVGASSTQPANPNAKNCPGIPAPGCDYLATCNEFCTKCGNVHHSHKLNAATQPSAVVQEPVVQADIQSLRQMLCGIGVVGQIDGHDVVRRLSVIDLVDRAATPPPVAGDVGAEKQIAQDPYGY